MSKQADETQAHLDLVEKSLSRARDRRAAAQKAKVAAVQAFSQINGAKSFDEVTDSKEAEAVASANDALRGIDAEIGTLKERQIELLRGTSDTDGLGGDDHRGAAHSFLADPEVRAQLEMMSSSKMPVGRVSLGQLVSREQLVAGMGSMTSQPMAAAGDVDATSGMRRGAFYGIASQIKRPLRLLDLIPAAPMDSGTFPYTQESGSLDTAREQTEGSAKATGAATFTDAEAEAKTIAHWTKLKKQALADQPALRATMENRLTYGVLRRLEAQIVSGDGTGDNIEGILATSGIASVAFDNTVEGADLVLDGLVDILIVGAVPNAVVLNPHDWAASLKAKASGDGQYFSAGPFLETAERMWGAAAIPSPAIAQGTALVGDFTLGATVFVREGVQVLVSDADTDDFTKNRVTLLGEGRFALAIWQPSAFAMVDLAA